MGGVEEKEKLVLVTRKPCLGLPTGCPSCLPVYIYLKFAGASFDVHFDLCNPDSDRIPYVECGDYVAFNNEKGGVIEGLKKDGIIDLDLGLPSHLVPDWLSTKVVISTWLADAVLYELWVSSDGAAAEMIYFSDLPFPIGKSLHLKQTKLVKEVLGITRGNTEERETEIYRRADVAYEALSMRLGEQKYFFENRPTSVDAIFLGHALFVLQASADLSVLRSHFKKYDNLVRYAENLKTEFLEASSSSSVHGFPADPSTSSKPKRGASWRWSSKPKSKPRREKTEEEKTFRRRAKYFLAAQAISILVFLSLLGGSRDDGEMIDDDPELAFDPEE